MKILERTEDVSDPNQSKLKKQRKSGNVENVTMSSNKKININMEKTNSASECDVSTFASSEPEPVAFSHHDEPSSLKSGKRSKRKFGEISPIRSPAYQIKCNMDPVQSTSSSN